MTFSDAIGALVGRPDAVAIRPSGEILCVTHGNAIRDLRRPEHVRPYVAKLSDVMGADWQVMSRQQFAAMLAKQQAQAA